MHITAQVTLFAILTIINRLKKFPNENYNIAITAATTTTNNKINMLKSK